MDGSYTLGLLFVVWNFLWDVVIPLKELIWRFKYTIIVALGIQRVYQLGERCGIVALTWAVLTATAKFSWFMGAFIHDYYLEKRRSRQFAIKSTTFMSQRVAEHEFKLKLELAQILAIEKIIIAEATNQIRPTLEMASKFKQPIIERVSRVKYRTIDSPQRPLVDNADISCSLNRVLDAFCKRVRERRIVTSNSRCNFGDCGEYGARNCERKFEKY